VHARWPALLVLVLAAAAPATARAAAIVEARDRDGLYRVRFRYQPVIAAERVALAGTFNNWDRARTPLADPDGDGAFEAVVPLAEGIHQYKFVVNGSTWITDPDAAERAPDGHGGENAVLRLGAADGKAATLQHEASPRFVHRAGADLVIRLRAPRGDASRTGVAVAVAVAGAGAGETPMECVLADDGGADWLEATVPGAPRDARYVFKIAGDKRPSWFGPAGLAEKKPREGFREPPAPARAFETPEWVRDAVFYQVFPERFRNGDKANDPQGPTARPWGAKPANDSFHGGDLRGLIEKLDYLTDLGVTALYLNPIFLAASNHKYDTADYLKIDPAFGDDATWKELVRELRRRDMRVILDGVFNHTGDEFFAFEDIKKKGRESRFLDWYFVREFPVVVKKDPGYECWWGFGDLPKLNVENPTVRAYLMDVGTRWIEAGADGWRLDVPNELPHGFWVEFRERVKRARKDAYIVGEIWNDATPWLKGDQFDAVMNYPVRDACLAFLARGETDAATFDRHVGRNRLAYPRPAVEVQFNLLGSHDTPRLRTLAGGDARRARLAQAFVFTYVGAPVVYYGDEVGLEGEKDPDCRRCFPWEEAAQDGATLDWVRRLAAIRRAEPALRRGPFRTRLARGPLYVYERGAAAGGAAIVCVLNAGEAEVEVPADAIGAGPFTDLLTGKPWTGRIPGIGAAVLKSSP